MREKKLIESGPLDAVDAQIGMGWIVHPYRVSPEVTGKTILLIMYCKLLVFLRYTRSEAHGFLFSATRYH